MQPHCYLRRAAARSFRQRRWSTAAAAAPQPLPPLRKGKRHVLSNASVIATSTMSSRQFATCRRGSGGGCCTYDTYPYPYFYHYHATHKRLRSLFSTTSNVTMEASTAHGTTALPQQQQPQPQPLPPPPSPKLYTPEQKQVMDQCKQWHSSITELNERIRGPLAHESDRGTALPFVLLVGNHSSGKSSFINYVLGRAVQTAGVAPTDDCFTIIAPGVTDRDQDGPAVTGDPDLGFTSLRQFGPTLQHHTVLKIRSNINCNFIMVDSPGMIDAPANYSGMLSSSSSTTTTTSMDRGYDFTGVVRWFADRADVVCLFFDPDKPGTTGETLSILLHALSGMDHKLLIILNKADQFEKIHDFARAYGSLCWNLSKVIPRKDLPRIYTMCLPVAENSQKLADQNAIPAALSDLYTAREEVVAQVRRAPERRMDNVLTKLQDAVSQLHMHASILRDLQTRYASLYWQFLWQELAVAATGTSLTVGLAVYGGSLSLLPVPQMTGLVLAATVMSTAGQHWYHQRQLFEWERYACTPEELSAAFARTHARAVADGDETAAALWQRIRDKLAVAVHPPESSFRNLPTVTLSDLQQLRDILDREIPTLRRQISPSHYGKGE